MSIKVTKISKIFQNSSNRLIQVVEEVVTRTNLKVWVEVEVGVPVEVLVEILPKEILPIVILIMTIMVGSLARIKHWNS